MQTIGPNPKEPKMPGHFLERCPSCRAKKWVPWIAYGVLCPKCDEEIAFVVYSASFELITKCPKCGVVPKDEAA
jgi:ribosomal protein S27E